MRLILLALTLGLAAPAPAAGPSGFLCKASPVQPLPARLLELVELAVAIK